MTEDLTPQPVEAPRPEVVAHLLGVRTTRETLERQVQRHLGVHGCTQLVLQNLLTTGMIPGAQIVFPENPEKPQAGDIYFFPSTDDTPILGALGYVHIIVPHHAFMQSLNLTAIDPDVYQTARTLADDRHGLEDIVQDAEALFDYTTELREFIIHALFHFVVGREMTPEEYHVYANTTEDQDQVYITETHTVADLNLAFQTAVAEVLEQMNNQDGFLLGFSKEQPYNVIPGDDGGNDRRIQTGGVGLSYEYVSAIVPLGPTAEAFLDSLE